MKAPATPALWMAVALALAVRVAAQAQDAALDDSAQDSAASIVEASPADAGSGDDSAQAAAQAADEAREAGARSQVQALGEGAEMLYLVQRPDSWSMFAEAVPAASIFALWHGVGGPKASTKVPLDFPFTMAVHAMTAERIVARVLDGFNYTLHYEGGHLAEVHVLSAEPSRQFKTPRLVEARKQWTNVEMTQLTGAGSPPAAPPADAAH